MDGVRKERTIKVSNNNPSPIVLPACPMEYRSLATMDIMVKAKTGAKFLKDGDKLKVSLRFRGREKDYVARGMEVMNKFAEAVSEVGDIDKKPNFEGRSLTMILTPKSDK